MNRAETIFGLGILAFGVFLLFESLKLPYFVEAVPGPGFLPFWISVGVIVVGSLLTARAVRAKSHLGERVDWPESGGWWRITIAMGALTLAILLMDTLGFFVTATLFVLAGAAGLGLRSWRVLIPVPLVSAFLLYQVFAVWLRVPLPAGILGNLG